MLYVVVPYSNSLQVHGEEAFPYPPWEGAEAIAPVGHWVPGLALAAFLLFSLLFHAQL